MTWNGTYKKPCGYKGFEKDTLEHTHTHTHWTKETETVKDIKIPLLLQFLQEGSSLRNLLR